MGRARKRGRPVRVGLGTDVGGGTTLSFLRTLGETYKVAQLRGWPMPAAHAFWLATQGGARALDLDDRIGNLVPGADADLVVLDCARRRSSRSAWSACATSTRRCSCR